MLEANVKIISALKAYLLTINENIEYKNFFRISKTDFTRERKLPFDKLALLIVQLCKKTLSVEVESFFNQLSGFPCSVAAFSMQRMKLKPIFFYCWNRCLWLNYYREYGSNVKRWKGFRVLGCDGSSCTLVNKPALRKYFGGQFNSTYSSVIAQTFYCYDVLNKLILFPQIGSYQYGELNMAYDFIEHGRIEQDMLLIFDRQFSNYKMAALLQFQEKEIKYVIRVKDSQRFATLFLAGKKESAVIKLLPSQRAVVGLRDRRYKVSQNTFIQVRLIRIQLPSGKIEVLMTNLWKEDGYTAGEFKALYSLRWGVETNIGFQKNILQLESFSGLSPTAVMQDFYATVMIANLYNLLVKPAQSTIDIITQGRKYPMQVNNNKAFGKLKENLVILFISEKPRVILDKLHDCFIRAPLPIRKGRIFPRITKNPMLQNKHKTFTNYKPAY